MKSWQHFVRFYSLKAGQMEKAALIQSLVLLGEDVTAIETAQDATTPVKASIASQTEFYGEVITTNYKYN